ncbi:Cobalamin biosynthesis protein GTP-binding protein [Halomicronema hongdechloris C2206]|uniref:Cobalamin biosynthesis protein GTP-binding protein n=1 Tax=Halomicronema hongdechloris C2206 TaxID=1641165 RepID=A0A1Z3HH48_9CYAN|nr:DUF1830 domain-containing protein [Halomicronema hongdechloris]ASC69649.1 Cobalamin biosynthesis protein GTP-binding protein [Halomicronema hongdechloris C2206]
MTSHLHAAPTTADQQVLCCYQNHSSKIQVIRIADIPDQYFERVVFPGQRLMFEAIPEARLEVHTGSPVGAILADTIPCDRIRVTT